MKKMDWFKPARLVNRSAGQMMMGNNNLGQICLVDLTVRQDARRDAYLRLLYASAIHCAYHPGL